MYVVVVGGGNVGYYLTKELLAAGHEVVVIEEDSGRARQIADELGSIVVANDGCEGRYQAEAGMGPEAADEIEDGFLVAGRERIHAHLNGDLHGCGGFAQISTILNNFVE